METKDQKFVICLGREYGSGGHNIGKALSKMLGIEYYDKKLLDEAAKNSHQSGVLRPFRREGSWIVFAYLVLGAFCRWGNLYV